MPPALGDGRNPTNVAPLQQGRQAGALLEARLDLFSATEEALRHLINSTPYVNTSKHRVPKAEACPASNSLWLPPHGNARAVTAHVSLGICQGNLVCSAVASPKDLPHKTVSLPHLHPTASSVA